MSAAKSAVALGVMLAGLAAARPAPARELRLVYETVETTAEKPAGGKKSQAAPLTVSQRRRLVTIGLGRRYFYRSDSLEFALADFERRRMVQTASEGHELVEFSLYPVAAFREMESQNRLHLRQVGKQLGAPDLSGSVLEIETEFGIPSGARPSRGDKLVREGREPGCFWRLNGDTAVVAEPAETALSPDDEAMLARYLLYMCRLHPDVRSALLATHRVPRRLTYRWNYLRTTTTVDMTLLGATVSPETTAVPPPGMAIKPALDSTLAVRLPVIRNTMLAGRAAAPTAEGAAAAARRDLEAGRALDALLRGAECSLMTGVQAPSFDKESLARLNADPRVQAYQQAVSLVSRGAPRDALAKLATIDRSDLELGYLIDLEVATARGMLGAGKDAAEAFLSVLEHNPYLGPAWSDLAIVYINGYDPWDGWKCVEMARQVAPAGADYLKKFDEHERRLVKQYPEFF